MPWWPPFDGIAAALVRAQLEGSLLNMSWPRCRWDRLGLRHNPLKNPFQTTARRPLRPNPQAT